MINRNVLQITKAHLKINTCWLFEVPISTFEQAIAPQIFRFVPGMEAGGREAEITAANTTLAAKTGTRFFL